VECALAGHDAGEDSVRIERMLSSLARRGEVAT
jgi:hypothetical protein